MFIKRLCFITFKSIILSNSKNLEQNPMFQEKYTFSKKNIWNIFDGLNPNFGYIIFTVHTHYTDRRNILKYVQS